jgi:hypothetical protein
MKYILYSQHNNRHIFNILKYLDYIGYNLEPDAICDLLLDNTPSIYEFENNKWYIGEKECIKFYTDSSLIIHLKDKADAFNRYYPNYAQHLYKIKTE